MKLETETLSKILKSLTITKDEEIGCDDCFEEIDQFVEMLEEGKDPEQVMPMVKHHLVMCSCCHEEYDALLTALGIDEKI